MITMDGALLAECGLQDLGAEAERELLTKLYADLEYRVGRVLSAGMSAAQLAEFERLIDAEPAAVGDWLMKHVPDYASDPLFRRLLTDHDEWGARAEFASTVWVVRHRPDYREVVMEALESLKAELRDDPVGTVERLQSAHMQAV